MLVEITIKHVNGMSKPKVNIDEGRIDYVLPFEVQLPPGDFDRITNLFRQRVPVMLTISSPQAKMDLFIETLHDPKHAPASEEEKDSLRQKAKDALITSSRAEHLLTVSGDDGDRRTADDAQRLAAEAVSAAATALDIPEAVLLTTLGEEVRIEMLAEGEQQADDIAAEAGETSDPAELRREIDAHVEEEGEDTGKPPTRRKTASAK